MHPTRPALPFVCVSVIIALTSVLFPLAAAAQVDVPAPDSAAPEVEGRQSGNASFYAKHFTGRRTASGERYDPKAMTAAHRTLPMGTKLRVTNPKNDRSVIVTVNDRGHLPHGRVVDVSSAAADALDMKKSGVTKVETHVVGKAGSRPAEAEADPARSDR